MRSKHSVADKYKSLNRTPPKAAQNAAGRGLEMRKEQKGDKAGLTNEEASEQGIGSGVQRATNLKNGDELSIETIKDMYMFFSRFKSQISKARKLKTREEQLKSNMYISDLLWGGEAAEKWVNRLWEQIQKIDEAAKKKARVLMSHRVARAWYLRQAAEGNFWVRLDITNHEEAEGYRWEVDEWLTIFQQETSAFTIVNSPFDYDHNPDLELAERPKAFFDRFVTSQIHDSKEYAINALTEINDYGDFDLLIGLLSDVVNTIDGAYGWAEQVRDTIWYPDDFEEKKRLLESSYKTLLEDIKKADAEIKRVSLMLYNDLQGLNEVLNPPLHETFNWNGIRIVNNGFPEKTVYAFLDHMSWIMDLFKRRGMDALILDSVREVILNPESWTFTNEKTHETQTAAGDYNPSTKTIRFLPNSLDPNNIGRFLKRWTAEVFLHELGHHIHLNLLPKEAKAFWDSGWAMVDDARKLLDNMRYITPEESEAYAAEIERANFDVNAVGRKKKGLERLKFLCYLNALELINTPKNVRLDSKVKRAISQYLGFAKDKDKFIDYLRSLSPYYANIRPEAIERVADYELGVLRNNLLSRFQSIWHKEVPHEVLEQIRAQDTSVDKALDALGIPSEYGKTNVKEDFAETFVEFMVHPEKLAPAARWRMGRTLGMSASLGTPVIKLTSEQIAFKVACKRFSTAWRFPTDFEGCKKLLDLIEGKLDSLEFQMNRERRQGKDTYPLWRQRQMLISQRKTLLKHMQDVFEDYSVESWYYDMYDRKVV